MSFRTEGDLELVGPKVVTAEGGMAGTYLRTVGRKGNGRLIIEAPGLEPVSLDFVIK